MSFMEPGICVQLTNLLDACGFIDFSRQKIIGLWFLTAIFFQMIMLARIKIPCAHTLKKLSFYSVDQWLN